MARQMKDSGIEWIGEIPHDWAVVPLQYHADLNTESLGEDTAPDYEFDYVEIGSVTLEGGINEYEHVRFADAPSRARRVVKANDIIVSTVRTYLKAIAIVPARENVIVSTGFAVLTPTDIDVGFLGFFLKSEYFVNLVTANSVGISYPAINASDLVKFKILLPSIEEQHRIAAFLDRKCAEIDAVIERTKTTIEEYKKLKQAVITKAVTKGVRGPRPMKDSGIEWIGEIPEGWDIVKLKYFLSDDKVNLRVGPFGSALAGSDFVEEGEWVYNQRIVLDDNFISNDTFVSASKYAELAGFEVIPDDVLITTRGSIGKVAIVPQDAPRGILHPCIIKFRVNQDMIPHSILKHVFNDTDFVLRQIKEMSNSTTIDVLYSYSLRNVLLPLIPMCEQPEIAAYLDEKCTALDTLIAKKTALLTELETYKKSLIYEYVTGKKEVL